MNKELVNIFVLFLFPILTVSTNPQCSNLDTTVLILGAGMSGINAARTLYDNGTTDFIIIEANSLIGGRIMQAEIKPGVKVEIGASWIQGLDPNQPQKHPLYALAQRCGGLRGNQSDLDSIIEYNNTGSIVSSRLDYERIETAYANVDKVSNTRQGNKDPDISVREALKLSNYEVVTDEEKWLDWFYFDFCFAEPPQNSSLFRIRPISTYNDFGDPDNTGDYLVTDEMGYAKLVRCLADGILGENNSRLRLNEKVNLINWSDECVCVTTVYNGETRQYCASYAIVTFSIGVLQSNDINMRFEPDLPQAKIDVINKFSMAHYLKIFVEFPTVFWGEEEYIAHISSTRGYFPLFQAENKFLPPNSNVLLMTVTGDIATRLVLQPENQTMDELMQVLRGIYGSGIPDPVNILLSKWETDPLVLGSYSNIPPGVTEQTFVDLAAPVGRVYFSGEATSSLYNGFVHGAYFAGRDSANAVLEAMSSSSVSVVIHNVMLCNLVVTLMLLAL